MHILHLDRVSVNYAGRVIFRDLSWSISNRARIGLLGPNGAGKSTLLKLLAGELFPTEGLVRQEGTIRIGYLKQDIDLPAGLSLLEAASIVPPRLQELEAQLASIEARLSDPAVYNDLDKLGRVMTRQEKALTAFEEAGGLRYGNLVREILHSLGFDESHYDLPVESLSGGQKKLVALASLAADQPDLLLLDEPDNHLDLGAKRALEAFIHGYPGGVVIVSHDRYLLDEVVDEVAELEDGKLTNYKGNYSAYTAERELQRIRQQRQYTTQQKEIAGIEAAIARFELWASLVDDDRHIKQARSRRKMLDRMEANGEIIDKVIERKQMGLELKGWRGSTKALEVRELAMGFDDEMLFVDLKFTLRHGERVGLLGPNGSGKSVLFRMLCGDSEPLDGEVIIGPSTDVGFYAQEHQTLADWLERTPLELVRYHVPRNEGAAVSFLLKMLFSYDQVRQPIGTMSGGERSRLQLALLMLQNPNLLLLDEPTNNLDIPSAEVLEEVLDEFEGTIFVVSHDRYFLDQVVDRVLVLQDGGLVDMMGGYTDAVDAGHEVG